MGITAAMCLQYPLSRGTVHIKSADPTEHPAIDPAFLAHPADAAVLAVGVKVREYDSKLRWRHILIANFARFIDA